MAPVAGQFIRVSWRPVKSNFLSLSNKLRPYLDKIGKVLLVDDAELSNYCAMPVRTIPRCARCQTSSSTRNTFGQQWCASANGFSLPLSTLLIYDLFIHSIHSGTIFAQAVLGRGAGQRRQREELDQAICNRTAALACDGFQPGAAHDDVSHAVFHPGN